jgi:hypothetical protein
MPIHFCWRECYFVLLILAHLNIFDAFALGQFGFSPYPGPLMHADVF